MLTTAIGGIITAILKSLPEDIVKKSLDAFIDKIENSIEGDGKTDWKDHIIIPLLSVLRKQIGITEEAGSAYEDKKTDPE